ncbi:MAG: 1-(5-phosphoribosyl)-5-[(5-phosphoribosylamino)methylideneamino]imidazole-4-carboxamide isomerase [Oxalobacter sp.]|nr:1-(5-phosphoribosyl)-5-[(5-phosphoribosylamino)methylideneamino]imidazole-4-carboxamide isomerase [Oxalobacter sp.]
MLLIPAVDMKDGACVRLKQGDMEQATVFSNDPAEMALHWLNQGGRRLHLVDLNGAFAGKPVNEQPIRSIIKATQQFAAEKGVEIPIELGGGIRDLHTIEHYLFNGISYIIIGTAAVKNPPFLQEACKLFPGQILVSLDAKDGDVAIDGWSKLTGINVIDLAKRYEDYGVNSIIYTDIGRDGMGAGINIDATVKLANAVSMPIIASGGLHDLNDVRRLCEVEDQGVSGVICGRAIYIGTLDLKEGQELADSLRSGK